MSKVFFTDMRARPDRSLLNKIETLLDRMKISKGIKKNDLVAVKLHFGEHGNCAFLRPVFVRTIVNKIRGVGGQPFLTDTNTLYKGSRTHSVAHLATAVENGFDYACIGCPIIIADGLRGANGVKVKIPGEVLDEVSIAKEIVEADRMIVVTHFKFHELTGFGGALKNLGMGCASREGKLVQHSGLAPAVNHATCKACRLCVTYCPVNAISLKEKKAFIDQQTCIGCGECIAVCPEGAIDVQWTDDVDTLQKKMVEHACGALAHKKNTVYLNFVLDVSPACDCYPCNDTPVVPDIGILASLDPVAIDAASADLVNSMESIPGTAIKHRLKKGDDKFRAVYPNVDWNVQLDHAQKLGLGERAYTLVKV
jgi:uncharacterized protein